MSIFTDADTLMQWREPAAYSRKDLVQRGRWIGLLCFLLVPPVLIYTSPSLGKKGRALVAAFLFLAGLIPIRIWFFPGDLIRLKKDRIIKGTGSDARISLYSHILLCKVSRDCYKTQTFSVLNFELEKGIPPGQIAEIAVPEGVDVQRVLEIMRSSGIKTT